MALIVPPRVMEQLAGVPRTTAGRLLERLQRVADDLFASHPDVKPLAGRAGSFGVRQGDWRTVYTVEAGEVIVERVGHRRLIYR